LIQLISPINDQPANGERYPLVGGTRQHRFGGTNSKPRKLSENAQTPTSRVHALLGAVELEDSIATKRHHRQTDKIIAHDSTFGKNQKAQSAKTLNNRKPSLPNQNEIDSKTC